MTSEFEYERRIKKLEKENAFLREALKEMTENFAELFSEVFLDYREELPNAGSLEVGVEKAKIILKRYRKLDREKRGVPLPIMEKLFELDLPKDMSANLTRAIEDFLAFVCGEETNFGKFQFLRDRLFAALEKDFADGLIPEIILLAAREAMNSTNNPEELTHNLSRFRRKVNA